MVRLIVLISLNFIAVSTYGQNDSLPLDELIFDIESMPYFSSGKEELHEFIESQIDYPKNAEKMEIEGTVYVKFFVDTLGRTENHEIVRGLENELDEEALRVTKLIIFEEPAIQGGRKVRVRYLCPVRFELPRAKRCRKE